MAAIYADLVRKGLRSIDYVPELWRDEVIVLLAQYPDTQAS